jgi:uncharacterized protein (TIGR03437 family)
MLEFLTALVVLASPGPPAQTYSGDSIYGSSVGSVEPLVSQVTSTLSLTANPAAASYGQTITLTATLSAPAGSNPSPTGSVQILDGSSIIASLPIAGYSGITTVSNLSAGTHTLSASYAGDVNWQPARSAPVTLAIGQCPTTATLALSPVSATDTQMTLTAAVTPANPVPQPPGGTVQITDQISGAVLATAPVVSGSAAATVAVTADPVVAVYSGDANFAASTSAPVAQIAVVTAAGFTADSFAPDELVSIFGSNLGTAGTSVMVTDSTGAGGAARLLYAGPTQINLVLFSPVADGPGIVTVTTQAGAVFRSRINIGRSAPGIFSMNASGQGPAAAQIVRVHTDGTVTVELVTGPISVGSEPLYLVLYGTGIRHASSVTCTINSQSLPVSFAGAQPQFPGLDQVDVPLPAGLRGAGQVNVSLNADGKVSNAVTLVFQ